MEENTRGKTESEKKSEQNTLFTNAQEPVNKLASGKLLQIEAVEGTPFNIVRTGDTEEDMRFHISIGNKVVTLGLKEEEKAKETIRERDWELITSLIVVVCERVVDELLKKQKPISINDSYKKTTDPV